MKDLVPFQLHGWRQALPLLSLAALMAAPCVGHCADPDLASPEGVIAYTVQIGTQNTAHVWQQGVKKIAGITQVGSGNAAAIAQAGANDAAIATQYGYGNSASIVQTGVNDAAAVRQYGAGNNAFVGQFANNQSVAVNQIGLQNQAIVIQTTPGLPTQTINQAGIGRTMLFIR